MIGKIHINIIFAEDIVAVISPVQNLPVHRLSRHLGGKCGRIVERIRLLTDFFIISLRKCIIRTQYVLNLISLCRGKIDDSCAQVTKLAPHTSVKIVILKCHAQNLITHIRDLIIHITCQIRVVFIQIQIFRLRLRIHGIQLRTGGIPQKLIYSGRISSIRIGNNRIRNIVLLKSVFPLIRDLDMLCGNRIGKLICHINVILCDKKVLSQRIRQF